jgi:hypothetical protein
MYGREKSPDITFGQIEEGIMRAWGRKAMCRKSEGRKMPDGPLEVSNMKRIMLIGFAAVLTLAGGLRPELVVIRPAAPLQSDGQPAGEKPEKPADDIKALRLYVMLACGAA